MSFEFISWITPLAKDFNAIMCNTLQVSKNKFILAYRKRYRELANKKNAIEALVSEDGCRTWRFLSTVKIMESNSNPPALVELKDGRLCCIYGDHHNRMVCGKYSEDGGKTWGEEFIIRKTPKMPISVIPDWCSERMVSWWPYITGLLRNIRSSILQFRSGKRQIENFRYWKVQKQV